MSPLALIGAIALSIGVAALAVVLIRFNRKRRFIIQCAHSATPEKLERIYTMVEKVGTVPSTGYVLARTNRRTQERRCLVPIPGGLSDFPWAGSVVEARVGPKDVEFQFVEVPATEPSLLGQIYRPVLVPRFPTKNAARQRNVFSPGNYIVRSPELLAELRTACVDYPYELLSYLLCAGRESFEFEPIDQARIGTSAAWVQDPEHQTCDQCRKRMQLILQLPGTVISEKSFHRGTFFLFGCPRHPHLIKHLGQFT